MYYVYLLYPADTPLSYFLRTPKELVILNYAFVLNVYTKIYIYCVCPIRLAGLLPVMGLSHKHLLSVSSINIKSQSHDIS